MRKSAESGTSLSRSVSLSKSFMDLPAALMYCLYKSFYFPHSLHKRVRLYAAWFYNLKNRIDIKRFTSRFFHLYGSNMVVSIAFVYGFVYVFLFFILNNMIVNSNCLKVRFPEWLRLQLYGYCIRRLYIH